MVEADSIVDQAEQERLRTVGVEGQGIGRIAEAEERRRQGQEQGAAEAERM